MSQTHTHGPGETHSHSHGPGAPTPAGAQQPQQVQQVVTPLPDPAMQALIEADFRPVALKVGEPKGSRALCSAHALDKCSDCGLDFMYLNFMSRFFVDNPTLICPPPPQVVQQQRAQAVTKTKDEGNILFKKNQHSKAVEMYTMAANIASQRLPWEPNNLMKEELGNVLSNRSASYAALGDHIAALADAEAVIQVKKPWSKGYFRKAKALVELGELEEAREAVRLALVFEPDNADMSRFMANIEKEIGEKKD